MPGGFVPYHHSTGKKYKNPGYTSGGSKSGGTGKGSATYGSPSHPYVPSSSSTSYSGSSSSSKAASKAVAQAQAAVKAAKAVVSEYGKDKKNPKSVSGKYAKATEKAKKKREKTKAKVERKTQAVQKKYASKTAKAVKTVAKTKPGRHYFEDGSSVSQKKYDKQYALPKHPRRAAQRRSDALYAKTGLPGKAPKVQPAKRPHETNAGNDAAAWVKGFGNKIRFAPPAWGGLTGSRMGYDDATKSLMLHEFAHTKQNRAVQRSGDAEGLATRFAARTGRRLGIEPSVTPEYRRYKEAAPAAPKLVTKAQFRGPQPRKPALLRGQFQGKAKGATAESPKPPTPGKIIRRNIAQADPAEKKLLRENARYQARHLTEQFGKDFFATAAGKKMMRQNPLLAKEIKARSGQASSPRLDLARRTAKALGTWTAEDRRAYKALADVKQRTADVRKATAKMGDRGGPKPRKVAHRLEKAVRKAGPDTSAYKDLGPAAPQLAEAAVKYGKEFGIDPSFLMAIAEIESGFGAAAGSGTPGAGAVSNAGAQGYMQFMPESRDAVLKATGYDAYSSDPKEAMAAAAGYFSVFAPDATNNWDRAYSYNHAGWYADDVLANAKKYTALDNAEVSNVPTQIKRTARQTLGKKPTQAILKGGTVVKDKNAGEMEKGAPSYKETKPFIVPAEAKSEIRAEQRAPARTMVTGMDPALQSALVQLAKNTGIPVRINEGYRTAARANDFPSGTASQHHQGNAADIDNNADYSAEDLAKVGLNNTAVGGEPWHFQLNNPDATASTVDTNIPIKGTNLAVQMPAPSASGTTGTTTSGGTTSTGAPVPGTPEYQQMMNEVRRKRGPSVAKRLAAIDRWMTSPVTAPTPEISQELIDRILGK